VDVSPSATLTDTQPSRASRILLMCVSIMRRTRKNTSDPAGGVHGICGYHAARAALRDLFLQHRF
jgi:hypothetical protein